MAQHLIHRLLFCAGWVATRATPAGHRAEVGGEVRILHATLPKKRRRQKIVDLWKALNQRGSESVDGKDHHTTRAARPSSYIWPELAYPPESARQPRCPESLRGTFPSHFASRHPRKRCDQQGAGYCGRAGSQTGDGVELIFQVVVQDTLNHCASDEGPMCHSA